MKISRDTVWVFIHLSFSPASITPTIKQRGLNSSPSKKGHVKTPLQVGEDGEATEEAEHGDTGDGHGSSILVVVVVIIVVVIIVVVVVGGVSVGGEGAVDLVEEGGGLGDVLRGGSDPVAQVLLGVVNAAGGLGPDAGGFSANVVPLVLDLGLDVVADAGEGVLDVVKETVEGVLDAVADVIEEAIVVVIVVVVLSLLGEWLAIDSRLIVLKWGNTYLSDGSNAEESNGEELHLDGGVLFCVCVTKCFVCCR